MTDAELALSILTKIAEDHREWYVQPAMDKEPDGDCVAWIQTVCVEVTAAEGALLRRLVPS